jgi:hypothetical protein
MKKKQKPQPKKQVEKLTHRADSIGANAAGSLQRIADAFEAFNERQERYEKIAVKLGQILIDKAAMRKLEKILNDLTK